MFLLLLACQASDPQPADSTADSAPPVDETGLDSAPDPDPVDSVADSAPDSGPDSAVDSALLDTGTGDTGGGDTGDTYPKKAWVADFLLVDENPGSPTYGLALSPRDYLEQVSGWYFIHAT